MIRKHFIGLILGFLLTACNEQTERSLSYYAVRVDTLASKIINLMEQDKCIFESDSSKKDSLTRYIETADRSTLKTVWAKTGFLQESPNWQWYLTEDEVLNRWDSTQLMIAAEKLAVGSPSNKVTALIAVLHTLAAERGINLSTAEYLVEAYHRYQSRQLGHFTFHENVLPTADSDTLFKFMELTGLIDSCRALNKAVFDTTSIYTIEEIVRGLEKDYAKYRQLIEKMYLQSVKPGQSGQVRRSAWLMGKLFAELIGNPDTNKFKILAGMMGKADGPIAMEFLWRCGYFNQISGRPVEFDQSSMLYIPSGVKKRCVTLLQKMEKNSLIETALKDLQNAQYNLEAYNF